MTITVSDQFDGSFAAYEVKHEIDGIYKAVRLNKIHQFSYHFPEKIILIRFSDGWTSDCPTNAIGLKIGQKINEHERPT